MRFCVVREKVVIDFCDRLRSKILRENGGRVGYFRIGNDVAMEITAGYKVNKTTSGVVFMPGWCWDGAVSNWLSLVSKRCSLAPSLVSLFLSINCPQRFP